LYLTNDDDETPSSSTWTITEWTGLLNSTRSTYNYLLCLRMIVQLPYIREYKDLNPFIDGEHLILILVRFKMRLKPL